MSVFESAGVSQMVKETRALLAEADLNEGRYAASLATLNSVLDKNGADIVPRWVPHLYELRARANAGLHRYDAAYADLGKYLELARAATTPYDFVGTYVDDLANVIDMIEAKAVIVSDPFTAAAPVLAPNRPMPNIVVDRSPATGRRAVAASPASLSTMPEPNSAAKAAARSCSNIASACWRNSCQLSARPSTGSG